MFSVIFLFCSALYGRSVNNKLSIERIGRWLEAPSSGMLYKQKLSAILDWLDSKLVPDNEEDDPKPQSFSTKVGWHLDLVAPDRRAAQYLSKNPFGWPLLTLCLKLALLYPIWVLLAASLALNIDAQIGAISLLPKDSPIWLKLALAYALVAIILVQSKPIVP